MHLNSLSENRFFFGLGKKPKPKPSQDSLTTSKTDLFGGRDSKQVSSNGDENGGDNASIPELIAGSEDKLQLLRKLVTKKNAMQQSSFKMHGLRAGHLDSLTNDTTTNLFAKFLKRKKEVDELERLTDKIKAYIKENKKKLIHDNSEMERRIFEI